MSVTSYNEIRLKVREAIRDTHSLLWDDDGLDGLINEAQREYSLIAGTLTGTFNLLSTDLNIYAAPVDFIEPVRVYDADGLELGIYSWRLLEKQYGDWRTITGGFAKGICFDFDGHRKYRIFPKLESGVSVGHVVYKRVAAENTIETRNEDAIINHCLFQMFLLAGDSSTENYWTKFISSVQRENGSMQVMKARSRIRSGRYF